MAVATTLDKVKLILGITTDYQDAMLTLYIDDVKAFMRDAGVSSTVVESDAAVGCIARGVNDLWHYGAGTAKLSEYFKQRVIQLAGDGNV